MSADAKTLQAMLTLLANAGITPDDLQAASRPDSGAASGVPTVAQFVPQVAEVTSPTTRRTYGTYWNLMVTMIGTMRLDQVKPLDITRVAATARDKSAQRRNSRGGVGAQENAISAMRVIFRHAVANKLVRESPAAAVPKPRRKKSTRRSLSDDEVFQVWEVVASGGDDPELDALLFRFFLETGARRGGALGLRLRDVNTGRQQVRLFEKGDTQRWQPISATLLDALLAHAHHRGARDPDESVFRYRAKAGVAVGRPLTRRRLNTLADRIQEKLPWAGELGVSPHWFRHTAVTAIERIGGYAVARAFAGHTAENGEATNTYIKARENEVAQAVQTMTGESHPLARQEEPDGRRPRQHR